MASPVTQQVKNPPVLQEHQETRVWSLGWEDPLDEEMTAYSSVLAWKIPWTEEPGGLQSKGLHRIRHDWAHIHDWAHRHDDLEARGGVWGCYCSVTKSGPTLCDHMNCSNPGFPVLHCLLQFAQTHVHWAGDAIQSIHPLSSPLLLPSIFPSIRVFPNELALTSHSQSIRTSASVLPLTIQGWFLLGLTGLISLLSKGLSRVFFSTII